MNIAAVDDARVAPTGVEETDAALVRRTARGDHDALRALYARYGALADQVIPQFRSSAERAPRAAAS